MYFIPDVRTSFTKNHQDLISRLDNLIHMRPMAVTETVTVTVTVCIINLAVHGLKHKSKYDDRLWGKRL